MPPKKDVKTNSNPKIVKDEDIPILNFLYENNNIDESNAIKTIEIAKGVFGSEAKKKSVNPGLYRLLNLKMVIKFVNEKGTNPRWCLSPGWSPNSTTESESQPIILNMLPSTSSQGDSREKEESEPSLPQGFIALNLTGNASSSTNLNIGSLGGPTEPQIAVNNAVLPPMPSIPKFT